MVANERLEHPPNAITAVLGDPNHILADHLLQVFDDLNRVLHLKDLSVEF